MLYLLFHICISVWIFKEWRCIRWTQSYPDTEKGTGNNLTIMGSSIPSCLAQEHQHKDGLFYTTQVFNKKRKNTGKYFFTSPTPWKRGCDREARKEESWISAHCQTQNNFMWIFFFLFDLNLNKTFCGINCTFCQHIKCSAQASC